jgi:hypothetical protein
MSHDVDTVAGGGQRRRFTPELDDRPAPGPDDGTVCPWCDTRYWPDTGGFVMGAMGLVHIGGPYCTGICARAAHAAERKEETMRRIEACERHCTHVVGELGETHGPYAPKRVLPKLVHRCCFCGVLTLLDGTVVSADRVRLQDEAAPAPARAAAAS